MKIMLQGYLHDANFGDVLAGYLFYERCRQIGFEEIDFYQRKGVGIGEFCRQAYGYKTKKRFLSCFGADAFVIISGGSFWNDKNRAGDAKTRFRRFILPARIYQLLGKPVYVLGVGGGAVDTPWLRKSMVKLLNKAKVVTFRDAQTKEIFEAYGVTNEMTVTADTVLTLTADMPQPFEEKESLNRVANGRKKLLLHLHDGVVARKQTIAKVLPALITFLTEHKEYLLVLSNDNIKDDIDQKTDEIYRALDEADIEFYEYRYHDCLQMCSLINEMDCVITPKLHVGAVACAFNKCVVSFPVHREKTNNFYQMVGESDRCLRMKELDEKKAYNQICKYHDRPVYISDEQRAMAEKNLAVLDGIATGKSGK